MIRAGHLWSLAPERDRVYVCLRCGMRRERRHGPRGGFNWAYLLPAMHPDNPHLLQPGTVVSQIAGRQPRCAVAHRL